MKQDATWYGGRPRPRRHCDRWGPSSPATARGTATPHFSAHMSHCGQTVGRPCQQLLSSCCRAHGHDRPTDRQTSRATVWPQQTRAEKKGGDVSLFTGELDPNLNRPTMSPGPRPTSVLRTKSHFDPSSRLPQHMWAKSWGLCPLEELVPPSTTMSPTRRPHYSVCNNRLHLRT